MKVFLFITLFLTKFFFFFPFMKVVFILVFPFLGFSFSLNMASSSSSAVSNANGARNSGSSLPVVSDGGPPVDWEYVRMIRAHRLAKVPNDDQLAAVNSVRPCTVRLPHVGSGSLPPDHGHCIDMKWQCFVCSKRFHLAQDLHSHVPHAHPHLQQYFDDNETFFIRCLVCCEYRV